jgi:DNA-3-methyladenine glycosylase I
MSRCDWCGDDPLYVKYHDDEWGVPLRDEQQMFEFLMLEGAQAGLSWITILRKREGYRRLFDNFHVETLAGYSDATLEKKLTDASIVRNRLKVFAARQNAQATLKLYGAGESLSGFLWRYVDGEPIQNSWRQMSDVPAKTPLAERISKDLRRAGFSFVGPTIIYAHMQATGMVNDHLVNCPRHSACARLA